MIEIDYSGKMDPHWTEQQKLAWCEQRFQGWKCAVFMANPPKLTRVITVHGLVVVLSPCGIINALRIVEWIEKAPGTVIANRGANWDRPVGYWPDEQGFLWWVTQLWLSEPVETRYSIAKPWLVWRKLFSNSELLHEAVAKPTDGAVEKHEHRPPGGRRNPRTPREDGPTP